MVACPRVTEPMPAASLSPPSPVFSPLLLPLNPSRSLGPEGVSHQTVNPMEESTYGGADSWSHSATQWGGADNQ